MKTEVGLESLERESYLAYHRDGILDALVGLALVGMGLFIRFGNADMGVICPLIAIILHPGLKKYVTKRRLGYVKFAPYREARLKANKWVLLIFFAVTALDGMVVAFAYSGDSQWNQWARYLGAIPVGVVLAATSAVLGILYGLRRGLIYALVILAVFVIGRLIDIHISVQLFMLGAMLSITGAAMFLRFVRRYPKPAKESSDAS